MAFKERNGIFATGDTGQRVFVTVDWDAVGKDELKAGTPLNEAGKIANDATAIGIVANDSKKAYDSRVLVVVSGYIDLDAAQKNSGIALSAACKSALVNIVFTGAGARGVTSWNDLTDRPFGETVETVRTLVGEDTIIQEGVSVGIDISKAEGKSVVVTLNGTEFESTCTFDRAEGHYRIFFDGEREISQSVLGEGTYVSGVADVAPCPIKIETVEEQTITKPLDTKYLPKALQFGESVETVSVIEWDGTPTDVSFSTTLGSTTVTCYKVSDLTPDSTYLVGGRLAVPSLGADSEITAESISISQNVAMFSGGGAVIAYEDGAGVGGLIFPEKGIYGQAMNGVVHSFTLTLAKPIEVTTITPIPTEYLPSPYVINYDDLPIENPNSAEWSEIVRRVEEAVLHNQRVLLDFGGELIEGTARIFPESGYQVGQVIFLSKNGSNLRYDVIDVNQDSADGGRFLTYEIAATTEG